MQRLVEVLAHLDHQRLRRDALTGSEFVILKVATGLQLPKFPVLIVEPVNGILTVIGDKAKMQRPPSRRAYQLQQRP